MNLPASFYKRNHMDTNVKCKDKSKKSLIGRYEIKKNAILQIFNAITATFAAIKISQYTPNISGEDVLYRDIQREHP